MNYVLKNIKQLLQIREQGVSVLNGSEMKTLPSIWDAYLIVEEGKIKDFGTMKDFASAKPPSKKFEEIDCSGKLVLPAFCDSHTHLVFSDTREHEFVDRIKGLTYEEIAARGGGIFNSAKKLNDSSEDELLELAKQRLEEIKSYGTGAVEIKSGYGLSLEGELKMLRVIKKLKKHTPLTIKATFLGAHIIPSDYKNKRRDYIRLLTEVMMPKIADEQLADYCDVFCEKEYFTKEESIEILGAGLRFGLKPKVHANQLSNSGGVQAGVKVNAVSVDHLEFLGEEEINLLKNSDTIATLLPGAAFFLDMKQAPARLLLDNNVKVALATDYNPGTSPSGRLGFIISLACIQLKMTPEEAINAATLNGACAMGVETDLGSITKGKKANLIITRPVNSIANIPYSYGNDVIERVIISN
jgi:imidazolonepropionase